MKLGVVAEQVVDGGSGGLVGVEDGEAIPSLGLQTYLTNEGYVLEEGDDILLGSHGVQIADINGGVVQRGGGENLLVGERYTRTVVSGRATVCLLIGPVDAQWAGAEPFSVEGAVRIDTKAEEVFVGVIVFRSARLGWLKQLVELSLMHSR